MLHRIAKAGTSRSNVCRNLHRLLKRSGAQYPVPLTTVPVSIRLRKPKPHSEVIDWPIIRISDWAQVLLQMNPKFLLGGHRMEDIDGWKMMLCTFWDMYRMIDEQHPMYCTSDHPPPSNTIPYCLRGDEGRGLRNKPFLVESFQAVIGLDGLFGTNESGHLGTHIVQHLKLLMC